MKQEEIFLVTWGLLAMTAMTYALSSSTILTVQPERVKVKQGNSVTLWCRVKQDMRRVVPVHWQSPPSFRTRSTNCVSFVRDKYGISCGESPSWYNLTVKDVQWADRGKYRCIHTKHMGIVDLKVLVPVREVSLTNVSTSEPLVLSKGVDAVLTCKTNCAYPAPNISWFENAKLFNGSASVNYTESGCTGEKEGQKRTISTITVTGKYMNKERKESKIFCVAENIGEPTVSKAMDIKFEVTTRVTTSQPQVVMIIEHPVAIALGATILGLILIFIISIVILIKKNKKREDQENLFGCVSGQSRDQTDHRYRTNSAESNQSNTVETSQVSGSDLDQEGHGRPIDMST